MSTGRPQTRRANSDGRRSATGATRRNRLITQLAVVLGAVVVVAGVVVAVVLMNQDSGGSATPEVDTSIAIGGNSAVPFSVAGTTVVLGDPDAPVQLDIYEDYSCPHCQEYDAAVGDTLLELAGSGQVVVRHHPIRIVTDYGRRAASSSACVAVGAADQWPTVHAALFANHSQTTDGWRTGEFRTFIKQLGVNDTAVLDCVQSGRYVDWVDANTTTALADGVQGTPTLMINGEPSELLGPDALREAVTSLLAPAA